MTEALYGDAGFYRARPGTPAAHYRTSPHVSPAFADALVRLAARVDAAIGSPDAFDVCDLGSGGGELLAAMRGRAVVVVPQLAARLRLAGVDVAPRPPGLADDIEWYAEMPRVTGLLIANEWLDNVPVDVVADFPDGARLLQVDEAGNERPGPAASAADREWVERWAPAGATRAEVGSSRDVAWARAVGSVRRGAALAIDYGLDGQVDGTLAGFRDGRQVRPVPDGSCDLTAHVQFGSVAAAGAARVGVPPLVLSQRDALAALGVDTARPATALAASDPGAYVAALADVSRRARLLDRDGLGGFTWLLQPVGIDGAGLLPDAAPPSR
jgi:SAM-dependent MidA family methyltransferase